jgi:geranylgeranyl diphosphate synthase type I
MEPLPIFERYQGEVEIELKSFLDGRTSPLYDMVRYHLGWVDERGQPRSGPRGKMLRPTLCLLSCEAVGGDWRRALPAAAAVELVHNFSLVHDDIEDESPERRGRPTLWCLWGRAQGINAGDVMHALSHLTLLGLAGRGVESGKVLQAARLLNEAIIKLCEGQYLDLCYENRLDIGVDDYLKMVSSKTASLFQCSLKLGALLGTGDEGLIEGLGRFGHNLGLAFQIRDDILDIWGQEEAIGKPRAFDIRKMKKTLPIIYGLAKSEELSKIYGKETLDEDYIALVPDIMEEVGARDYAQDMAQGYYRQAVSELESAPLFSQAKDELKTIAAFLIEREY